ncbi:hypothetical protein [Leptolyngbya sp. FACHB-261]|uniref:hypothetical protein n=1 Tax=Leptolyngbya sp. FACHB-261 TaxID=2692806 RepID=UPI00168950C7|nr:hypothetical protein [Leptolyngbya sp. FACHB-261]MBD2099341.1 hypothetical protein [Leptolyngbya sp. FACHB-261]
MSSSAQQRSLPLRLIVDAVVQKEPFEVALGVQLQRVEPPAGEIGEGHYYSQRLFIAGLSLSLEHQVRLHAWLDYELASLSAQASRADCAIALKRAWSGFCAQTYQLPILLMAV